MPTTIRIPIGRWIDAWRDFFVAAGLSVSLKTVMHMTSSLTVYWPISASGPAQVLNGQTGRNRRRVVKSSSDHFGPRAITADTAYEWP